MSSDTIRAAQIQARSGIIAQLISGAFILLAAIITAGWITFEPSAAPATSVDANHYLIAKTDAIAIGVSIAIGYLVLLALAMRDHTREWLFWIKVFNLLR